MAATVSFLTSGGKPSRRGLQDPLWLRAILITLALGFLVLFLLVPLVYVFMAAFEKGFGLFLKSLSDPDGLHAIWLTALVAAIVVPLNTVFGLAAAWAITQFRFRGKNLLITLIDLPFAVSPVVAGLVFVLLFGRNGFFGPFLFEHDFKVIYALPGIVLATLFVTFPFVAREVIPLMQSQGNDEEQAALTLGANGFQIFWKVTIPKIRWALIYGIILCNARSMGEFGAVSVVSGMIRGQTNTMPLQIENLYNEYQTVAAFSFAAVLALLALLTLVIKVIIEARVQRQGNESGLPVSVPLVAANPVLR